MKKIITSDTLKSVKCECQYCKGSGLEQIIEDKAVVCTYCNGYGYYERNLKEIEQIIIDTENEIFYIMENSKITLISNVFKGLKILDKISKVIYINEYNSRISEPISYKDFLKGYLPKLHDYYGCPTEFLGQYRNSKLDNSCISCDYIDGCIDCNNYKTRKECWSKFYKYQKESIKVYKKDRVKAK